MIPISAIYYRFKSYFSSIIIYANAVAYFGIKIYFIKVNVINRLFREARDEDPYENYLNRLW